jgi:ribose transport system ATP-binding protein
MLTNHPAPNEPALGGRPLVSAPIVATLHAPGGGLPITDSALEVASVTKRFPGGVALDDVSMSVQPGEVHALLGENGAGKSTLIKIVSGALAADQGTVRIGGVPLARATPRAAQRLGVRVIHQERQIAPDLTVAENLLLDLIPTGRLGLVRRRRTERVAAERLAALGIDLDPGAPSRSLGVAQQQLLELARAVSFEARLVIMDEPTASLHREEVRTLFAIVGRLRARGVAVLFISHHLDEVFAVAERVTVLRDGRVAGTRAVDATDAAELISLIFGKSISTARHEVRPGTDAPDAPADPVVAARDVAYRRAVRGVTLSVAAGEILALTGGQGSGASELAQLLSGCLVPGAGEVVHGTPPVRLGSRTGHTRAGVAFLPADRKREGLLLDHTVRDNILLSRLALRGERLTRFRRDHRRAGASVDRLAIKTPGVDAPVRVLSGGNQQKCILARWLQTDSRLLVLDEPTAGVDISSKLEIYRRLVEVAATGVAVVFVSSDYEEISVLADRVLVMRDGRVVGELAGADADVEALVQTETGA